MLNDKESSNKRRGLVKTILKDLLICGICSISGLLLLLLGYHLPKDNILQNMRTSAETIRSEGTYPVLSESFTSQLDNWTDSVMLLEIAEETDLSATEKALRVPRGKMNGLTPAETLSEHFTNGTPYDETAFYARYWHGYLPVLRILFEGLDYAKIRILNAVVQILLFLASCFLLAKKASRLLLVPWILAYGMMMPPALFRSLQFSSCYYVYMLSVIALLCMNEKQRREKAAAVFLFTGIALAYFDFFTYPAAAFGVPAAVCLILEGTQPLRNRLINLLRYGLSWLFGYGVMWILKWVLAGLILHRNVFSEGLGAAAARMAHSGTDESLVYRPSAVIAQNYQAFARSPFFWALIACCVVFLLILFLRRGKNAENLFSGLLPFLLLGLIPVVWFAVTVNHSAVHYWFANKACVVTFLAVPFGLAERITDTGVSEKTHL